MIDAKINQPNEVPELVLQHAEMFIANLTQVLRNNAFSNRMLITPRSLGQIALEEFGAFSEFLQTQDIRDVMSRGHQLAFAGLGQSSVLGLSSTLHKTCFSLSETGDQLSKQAFNMAESYTSALLEGYMAGREEELRQEQELTWNAFNRTQT